MISVFQQNDFIIAADIVFCRSDEEIPGTNVRVVSGRARRPAHHLSPKYNKSDSYLNATVGRVMEINYWVQFVTNI